MTSLKTISLAVFDDWDPFVRTVANGGKDALDRIRKRYNTRGADVRLRFLLPAAYGATIRDGGTKVRQADPYDELRARV